MKLPSPSFVPLVSDSAEAVTRLASMASSAVYRVSYPMVHCQSTCCVPYRAVYHAG